MPLVTTVIPHIPVRANLLGIAVASVHSQTHPQTEVVVVTDIDHRGAAWNISQGVARSHGDWVTLLGDDDWLLPAHHEHLLAAQRETGADVVYPWYEMVGRDDFQPERFGVAFDETECRRASFIPGGGSLIRGDLLRSIGIPQPGDPEFGPEVIYDDWAMYLRLLDAGARFHHLAERLYCWRVWPGNTSGKGDRW